MYRKLSAPVGIQWEVTPNCNHLCIWCYNNWRQEESSPSLPPNFAEIFNKTTNEIIDNKIMSVIITGGEPLMVFNQIIPYIKKLTSHGVQVYLNSNLTLITSKMANTLKESGVSSILASLPSGNPETCDQITTIPGSFQRIVGGVKIITEAKIPLIINMVVCKINLHQIQLTAKLVASLGVGSFAASRAAIPFPNSSFSNQVLDFNEFRLMTRSLIEAGEKFNLKISSLEVTPPCAFGDDLIDHANRFCGAARNNCTVGHDGLVRPCNRLPLTHGNILDGLNTAWDAMEEYRTDIYIPIECGDCRYRLRCLGGCKADSLVECGKMDKANVICDFSFKPKARKIVLPVINTTEFTVNPILKTRPENFGYIAFIDPMRWLPITKELKTLLTGNKTVTINNIAAVLCIDIEAAKKTVALMVGNRILFSRKEKKDHEKDHV